MPSIANVNYTVMQGDAGREMQNIRSFVQDTAQPVVVQEQNKKNEEKKVTVQNSDESGQIKFQKDKEREKQEKKKKQKSNKEKDAARASGREVLRSKRKRLLDIVV